MKKYRICSFVVSYKKTLFVNPLCALTCITVWSWRAEGWGREGKVDGETGDHMLNAHLDKQTLHPTMHVSWRGKFYMVEMWNKRREDEKHTESQNLSHAARSYFKWALSCHTSEWHHSHATSIMRLVLLWPATLLHTHEQQCSSDSWSVI